MNHCITAIVWSIWIATSITGLKIASYNTYQIFSNPIADDLVSSQLQEITASDVDIMCLQELFSPYKADIYADSLSAVYPYSFSALNIRSADDSTVPRTPCSTEEIEAFTTECPACQSLYPLDSFPLCMASYCPEAFATIHLSECAYCFIFAPTLISTTDIEIVSAFCGNEVNYLLNQTDGTMIISKLPIINTWSLPLPSWVAENRVNIVQIDVCPEEPPPPPHGKEGKGAKGKGPSPKSKGKGPKGPKGPKPCSDSVIVACTHLNPTAYKDPVATFVPMDQDQRDANLTSHIELNAYQIEYLLDNILSDDVSPWDSRDKDILGVFVAGDFNVGQQWFPDNFDLFEDGGYKDFGGGQCTVCLDPDEDDYNVLNADDGSGIWITDADSSRDLDHVLIRRDYLENFEDIKCENDFERIFLDEYNISNELIPLSDHWGVQLRLTLDKKPKPRAMKPGEVIFPRFIAPYSDGNSMVFYNYIHGNQSVIRLLSIMALAVLFTMAITYKVARWWFAVEIKIEHFND